MPVTSLRDNGMMDKPADGSHDFRRDTHQESIEADKMDKAPRYTNTQGTSWPDPVQVLGVILVLTALAVVVAGLFGVHLPWVS